MPDLFHTVLYAPTGVLMAPIAPPAVLQRFQVTLLGRTMTLMSVLCSPED